MKQVKFKVEKKQSCVTMFSTLTCLFFSYLLIAPMISFTVCSLLREVTLLRRPSF